jgi:hypothetical protein
MRKVDQAVKRLTETEPSEEVAMGSQLNLKWGKWKMEKGGQTLEA